MSRMALHRTWRTHPINAARRTPIVIHLFGLVLVIVIGKAWPRTLRLQFEGRQNMNLSAGPYIELSQAQCQLTHTLHRTLRIAICQRTEQSQLNARTPFLFLDLKRIDFVSELCELGFHDIDHHSE